MLLTTNDINKIKIYNRHNLRVRDLDYDDVRRGDECGGGEDDGEESEGQQAQSVQDHGGKLPLRLQLGSGCVCSDLVCDDRDLHPDALELLL